MQKTLKKLSGILIALLGFVILFWCLWASPYTLPIRLLINIAGVMCFGGGLYLAGYNPFGFGKPKEPYGSSDKIEKSIKKEESSVPLKKFEKDDHDKYMPK